MISFCQWFSVFRWDVTVSHALCLWMEIGLHWYLGIMDVIVIVQSPLELSNESRLARALKASDFDGPLFRMLDLIHSIIYLSLMTDVFQCSRLRDKSWSYTEIHEYTYWFLCGILQRHVNIAAKSKCEYFGISWQFDRPICTTEIGVWEITSQKTICLHRRI